MADCYNHRIQKFTPDGQFLKSVGTEGNGPLQFKYPDGITFNPTNNKVYVGDNWNRRVQVLNSDLDILSSFGEYGSGKRDLVFHYPGDLACDSTGKVYVANDHRIQVFTAEGKFLRMFGRHGHGRGELNWPFSITIDTSDRIYVGDLNHRISVFTSEGHFITSFGGNKGEGPGEFKCPRGLASGVVFVCDSYNNLFKYSSMNITMSSFNVPKVNFPIVL